MSLELQIEVLETMPLLNRLRYTDKFDDGKCAQGYRGCSDLTKITNATTTSTSTTTSKNGHNL